MNKEKQTELLNQGFYIVVGTVPNKQYDGMVIKAWFKSDSTNQVYPVYYNHVKSHLSGQQKLLIDSFKKANNIQFNHLVELNTKIRKGIQSTEDDMVLDIYRKNRDMVTIQIDNKGVTA